MVDHHHQCRVQAMSAERFKILAVLKRPSQIPCNRQGCVGMALGLVGILPGGIVMPYCRHCLRDLSDDIERALSRETMEERNGRQDQ